MSGVPTSGRGASRPQRNREVHIPEECIYASAVWEMGMVLSPRRNNVVKGSQVPRPAPKTVPIIYLNQVLLNLTMTYHRVSVGKEYSIPMWGPGFRWQRERAEGEKEEAPVFERMTFFTYLIKTHSFYAQMPGLVNKIVLGLQKAHRPWYKMTLNVNG